MGYINNKSSLDNPYLYTYFRDKLIKLIREEYMYPPDFHYVLVTDAKVDININGYLDKMTITIDLRPL